MFYEFSGFCIDIQKRLLSAGGDGRLVPLSPKVFETLLYFVERRGELLDKATLMKAVWPNVIVEENSLNQNISVIRRALGETPGQHKFIVTEPGRGYRFVADVRVVAAPSSNAGAARRAHRIERGRRAGGTCARGRIHAAQLDRGSALREFNRRSRQGVLQRRHVGRAAAQAGAHTRAQGPVAHFILRLQGPQHGRAADRARPRRGRCARGQRAQRRGKDQGCRAIDRRRAMDFIFGRRTTTATSAICSPCRMSWRTPS